MPATAALNNAAIQISLFVARHPRLARVALAALPFVAALAAAALANDPAFACPPGGSGSSCGG